MTYTYSVIMKKILFRLKGANIFQGNYNEKLSIGSEVENFYSADVGLALLYLAAKLTLPGNIIVDLRTVDSDIKWEIITRVASQWITYGEKVGSFKMASFNRSGKVQTTIDIECN